MPGSRSHRLARRTAARPDFFLQLRAFCPRQNCGAFYGDTPRQDDEIAGLLALFSNQLRFFRLPQHLAHDDGTPQSGR